MLAKLGIEVDETDQQRSSAQQSKPDPKDLWRPKDNQHKAQISSISFTIYTKLLYSCVVSIEQRINITIKLNQVSSKIITANP